MVSKKLYLIPLILFLFGFQLLAILLLIGILFLDGKIGFTNQTNRYKKRNYFSSFRLLEMMNNRKNKKYTNYTNSRSDKNFFTTRKQAQTPKDNVIQLRTLNSKIKRF